MGRPNSSINFTYTTPQPFALPVIQPRPQTQFTGSLAALNSSLPAILIPREGLDLSSQVLEEIMFNITLEARTRGNALPRWRRYKTGTNGQLSVSEFTNPSLSGTNLANLPVEYFALIVRDIQREIEKLVTQSGFGDSLAGYLARIFANNTISNATIWNNVTKLPTDVIVNTTEGEQTINPLALAQAGLWPFTGEMVGKIVSVMGVLTTNPLIQNANISTTAGEIETTDPNFPQSPYGQLTPSGIPGTIPKFKMTAANRTVYNRKNAQNSSLGVGAGQDDLDQGYGYLISVPHIIQQLRFQPPSVETFPNIIAVQDYASNIQSSTTPNLAWVQSLPRESQISQNWGLWLIKGQVGVTSGGAVIRAYNNPSAQAGAEGNCPFNVFFPLPTSNCSCGTGDDAYFIWHAHKTGFVWNELTLLQEPKAQPRFFGRNTRLAVDVTLTGGGAAGTQNNEAFFGVGIRTSRVSNVNLQPFHYVISKFVQGTPSVNTAVPGGTSFDVPIMENMRKIIGNEYQIGGLDSIIAIQILVFTRSTANWVCDAEDGPSGSFIPDSCKTVETCSAGSLTALVNNLRLYEPAIVGDPVSSYV